MPTGHYSDNLEYGHTLSRADFEKQLKADDRYWQTNTDPTYAPGDNATWDNNYGGTARSTSSWATNQQALYDKAVPTSIQYPTGRDPSSKTYASDTWADITRAQWQDYLDRFVPREDALLNMTTYENPGLVDSTMAIGKQAAAIGYDATQRMNQQAAGRYGAALTQGYQQNQDRRDNVGKSAAIVNEANRIRQELQDRNRQIALGTSNAAVSIREN